MHNEFSSKTESKVVCTIVQTDNKKKVSKELLEEQIANLENVLMGHRKELEYMEQGDDMYDRVVEQVSHVVKNSTLLLSNIFLFN